MHNCCNDSCHGDNDDCHGNNDGCHGDLHNGLEVTAKQFRLVTLNLPMLDGAVVKERVQLNRFISCTPILVLGLATG